MSTFDDLFNTAFGWEAPRSVRTSCYRQSFPSPKFKKEDGANTIEIAVPGCGEEDVSVEVEDDYLVIKAEGGGREVNRTFLLPPGTDPDLITATVEKGLLLIRIPENKKSRKIL